MSLPDLIEIVPLEKPVHAEITVPGSKSITKLQFSTINGKLTETELPLGGFGVSRYALDEFLCQKALENGCKIVAESVENIVFEDDEFTVTTSENNILKSKIVIGAFGKRSNVDQKLNRGFIQQKSPWLAVKSHYSGSFPDDLVGLHNFKGGYCGIVKIEDDKYCLCYLTTAANLQKYKGAIHR